MRGSLSSPSPSPWELPSSDLIPSWPLALARQKDSAFTNNLLSGSEVLRTKMADSLVQAKEGRTSWTEDKHCPPTKTCLSTDCAYLFKVRRQYSQDKVSCRHWVLNH
jgi:hypothetical protein